LNYDEYKKGNSISVIAGELEVHRSTIYRELKRNTGKRGYRFKQANEKAFISRLRNQFKV
jgi:transposase, IS30 family